MPVGQHSDDIEILDDDGLVMGEMGRELVQYVGANVGDPPVQPCQLGFRFGTIARAALLAGKIT